VRDFGKSLALAGFRLALHAHSVVAPRGSYWSKLTILQNISDA